MNRELFGKYLARLRKNKGFTQVDLSDILNISHQAISKWENGESMPDIDMLNRIASLYGLGLEELVQMKEEFTELKFNENQYVKTSFTIGVMLMSISTLLIFFSTFLSTSIHTSFLILYVTAHFGTLLYLLRQVRIKTLHMKHRITLASLLSSNIVIIGFAIYFIVGNRYSWTDYLPFHEALTHLDTIFIVTIILYYLIKMILSSIYKSPISITKQQFNQILKIIAIILVILIFYNIYESTLSIYLQEHYYHADPMAKPFPSYFFYNGYSYGIWVIVSIQSIMILSYILLTKQWKYLLYMWIPFYITFLTSYNHYINNHEFPEGTYLFIYSSNLLFGILYISTAIYLLFHIITIFKNYLVNHRFDSLYIVIIVFSVILFVTYFFFGAYPSYSSYYDRITVYYGLTMTHVTILYFNIFIPLGYLLMKQIKNI